MSYPDYLIDANQNLGNSYDEFRSELYAFALTDPKAYFAKRTEVLKKIKIKVVDDMYRNIYNLLKKGTDKDNNVILVINGKPPKYPENKINEHAMSGAQMMNDYVDEIVEILLPVDFATIMSKKLGQIGNATNPQNP